MLVRVVEIGDGGIDVAGAASAKIGGDRCEFLLIASYKEQARSLRGPDAAGRFGDAGGRTEDEDLAWSLIWSGSGLLY
jgi:hypothetical protein